MFRNNKYIGLESDKNIKDWRYCFLKDENMEKVFILGCPYSWFEVQKEYWRRASLGNYDNE